MMIESATQFPTVIFTIGLAVCLVYWLFVLLGALDIDLFHADADIGGGHADLGGHDIGDAGGHDVGDGGGDGGDGHDGGHDGGDGDGDGDDGHDTEGQSHSLWG